MTCGWAPRPQYGANIRGWACPAPRSGALHGNRVTWRAALRAAVVADGDDARVGATAAIWRERSRVRRARRRAAAPSTVIGSRALQPPGTCTAPLLPAVAQRPQPFAFRIRQRRTRHRRGRARCRGVEQRRQPPAPLGLIGAAIVSLAGIGAEIRARDGVAKAAAAIEAVGLAAR